MNQDYSCVNDNVYKADRYEYISHIPSCLSIVNIDEEAKGKADDVNYGLVKDVLIVHKLFLPWLLSDSVGEYG